MGKGVALRVPGASAFLNFSVRDCRSLLGRDLTKRSVLSLSAMGKERNKEADTYVFAGNRVDDIIGRRA